MTNLDTGVYGAKRQSFKEGNTRALLMRILDQLPKGTEKAHRAAFAKAIIGESSLDDDTRDYVDSLIEYWWANHYAKLLRERAQRAKPTRQVAKERAEAKAVEERAIERVTTKLRQLVLLDLVLPNGKALRDATGKECVAAGGWFAAVGKMVKPREVIGERLTEEQLPPVKAA